jgi:putative transcriptional regulator
VTIKHHLDDATLVSYAGGSLDEAFTIVVAAHLASCGECRARVRMLERAGGSLLEDEPAVPFNGNSFDRLMSRVNAREGESIRSKATATADDVLPLPLARLVGGGVDRIAWKTVAPGIATSRLPMSAGANSSLIFMRIAPGKKVPEHGHGGMEMTLVLQGSYRDVLGRFGPGDVADLDQDVEHQPIVDSDVPCICVVATESPTRFKGFFSRLLQPLVGI